MTAITTYANAARDSLNRLIREGEQRGLWKIGGAGLAAFFLSAASLSSKPMPLALGLLCAAPAGPCAVAIALGGCLGYLLFWGELQGIAWMAGGVLAVALVADRDIAQQQKLLMPAIASLVVAACGLGFLLWFQDDTAVPVYLVRVVLSALATGAYRIVQTERGGIAGWMVCGLSTLALAQVVPLRYFGLGYIAAGFLAVRCAFPGVAMTGLGLDLAQVTQMPMTGVLCLNFCLRLIPRQPRWLSWIGPGLTYVAVSAMGGIWDPLPLPGLLLGGALGQYAPGNVLTGNVLQRKGVVGVAQVRLEKAALGMEKIQQTLLLTQEPPLDRRALLRQVADDSCAACPERKDCKARHQISGLPVELLEQPGLQTADMPPGCKEPARILEEFRRGQEQLRRMKGNRSRVQACQGALQEQYGFLSEYLRGLSDDLCTTQPNRESRYQMDVGISSRALEENSGDRCVCFEGTGNFAFVLLCDGMGTGDGAARDARETISLLRQLLEAGYTPPMALRSFNSLCALGTAAGCATVDLLEMDLHSGRGTLYKWGAGASYVSKNGQLRKIGTAGPPPGLSQQARHTENRLSLAGGEVLIMLSDGAGEEGLMDPQWTAPEIPSGEAAANILEQCAPREDDATVVVVRLNPLGLDTQ